MSCGKMQSQDGNTKGGNWPVTRHLSRGQPTFGRPAHVPWHRLPLHSEYICSGSPLSSLAITWKPN